ncbi:hypothetical protein Patl1_25321 [Pistacia atlantica]|uniref:Uncharacterized protein n=1 Tax=Pistacia atlantica TaxID=434234 RepID=A0ACC1B4S2_9ROSI|nr:hypothetical protein Patl1_25321 [Pistacia atlantica]
MLPRRKIINFLLHLHSQNKPRINPLRYSFCNPFCTLNESPNTTESPELPIWLRSHDTQNPDEDFVIPSLASWVENHKLNDPNSIVTHVISEKTDTDVDKISKILKNKYPSPDEVVLALNGSCFSVSNSLVEHILKRFSNNWIPAFGLFTWAKTQTGYRHTPEIYNTMVDILGKSKNFGLMWEVVKEMDELKEGYVTLATMNKVMRRLARGDRYEDAIEAFRGFERYGLKKETMAMNILMDALAKENSVEHAYKVFLEFKNCIPLNSYTFNILLHGWCKARKLGDAERTIDEMQKHGLVPNEENAFKLLQKMEEDSCKPDLQTYAPLLKMCCKKKRMKLLNILLRHMFKNDISIDLGTYTLLVHGLCKSGKLEEACLFFEEMVSRGMVPRDSTYKMLVEELERKSLADAKEKMEKLMSQAKEQESV